MKKYVIKLKNSDHYIYKIGFGTINIGTEKFNEQKSKSLMTDFIEMGGNLIDTARYYHDWTEEDIGRSEKIVGSWLKAYKKRNLVFLTAKGGQPVLKSKKSRLSQNEITSDLNSSLKNMNTDYIDLYFIQGDDKSIPVGEIIETLEELVKQGKIINYGCSNWKADRIKDAMLFCSEKNYTGFVASQMLWNAGTKYMNPIKNNSSYLKMDDEIFNVLKEFEITAMPYNATANGFFAKLNAHEKDPEDIDIEVLKQTPYYTNKNLKIYTKLKEIGYGHLSSPGWTALSYLTTQTIQTCPLFSCTNITHLKEAFDAVEKNLTAEDFENLYELDEVTV